MTQDYIEKTVAAMNAMITMNAGGETMDPKTFRRFCDLAYKKAGIALHDGKEALVASRVAKRQRALGIPTAKEYIQYLEDDDSGEELVQFLDVISTNFTSFFREADHFSLLVNLVKNGLTSGQRRFRFWSAACSSGEEPYSIGISLDELFETYVVDWKILATDISTKVLGKAQTGVYGENCIKSISKTQKNKYFEKEKSEEHCCNLNFKICPQLKDHITFRRLNLSDPPFPMAGPFDMVFCRNVMIYFDKITRQNLVSEIERLLRPSGLLVVGHTETLTGISTQLLTKGPSVYMKAEKNG
jgi:chemotaxis protein methyltransferase CheR